MIGLENDVAFQLAIWGYAITGDVTNRDALLVELPRDVRDWALSHDANIVRVDLRKRVYSTDIDDYIELCARCHIAYDRAGVV